MELLLTLKEFMFWQARGMSSANVSCDADDASPLLRGPCAPPARALTALEKNSLLSLDSP